MAAANVQATHSLPPDADYWWDGDNDGVVDISDGDRYFLRIGLSWNATKEASASQAASAWAVNTSWDPTFTTSTFSIRVDGTFPGEGYCGSAWSSGSVAGNCVKRDCKAAFGFYDIYDSDIGIDLTPGSSGATWEYSASTAPSSTEYSLRGVLTHELGHGIRLVDVCGASDCDSTPVTMCGAGAPGPLSWELLTLATDDIDAANAVY